MRLIKTFSNPRNTAGDTIVEVLVSAAILAAVLSVAYATANHNLQNSTDADNRNQAIAYVGQQIEFIKNAAANSTAALATYQLKKPFCIMPNGTPWTVVDKDGYCTFTSFSASPFGLYRVGVSYDNAKKNFKVQAAWVASNGTHQGTATLYYSTGHF